MERRDIIQKDILSSIDLKKSLLSDPLVEKNINAACDMLIQCFKNRAKVLFCGNGGSAADAQHLSAELSGRYYLDREPLFCEALHLNASYLTAVANDYSFDEIYSRLVKAMADTGDVLICLSTSGNSANVVNAIQQAKQSNMHTISFTGAGGGALKAHSDIWFEIPSTDTPRIQECHMLIGHIICEIVEKEIFGDN